MPLPIDQNYPGIQGVQMLIRLTLDKADSESVAELGKYLCRDICNVVEKRTGTWIELLEVDDSSGKDWLDSDVERGWKEAGSESVDAESQETTKSETQGASEVKSVEQQEVKEMSKEMSYRDALGKSKDTVAVKDVKAYKGKRTYTDRSSDSSKVEKYTRTEVYIRDDDDGGRRRRGRRGEKNEKIGHSKDRFYECFTVNTEALNRVRSFLMAFDVESTVAEDHEAVIRRLTEKPRNLDFIAFVGLKSKLMHDLQCPPDKVKHQYEEWFIRIRKRLVSKSAVQHMSFLGHLRSVARWMLMIVDVFGLGAMILLPEMSWAVFESVCNKDTIYRMKKDRPLFARACDDVERMLKQLAKGQAVGSDHDNEFGRDMKGMIYGLERGNAKKQAERFVKIQKRIVSI